MANKIMFNDECGLTDAVLSGKKTQTRRFCKEPCWAFSDLVNANENKIFHFEKPKYNIGDIVSIAQRYKDIVENLPVREYARWMYDNNITEKSAGWANKMFVRADLMIHRIRITDVRVERLQYISDEDCLAEGVVKNVHKVSTKAEQYITNYYPSQSLKDCAEKVGWGRTYFTPKEAYAALINKLSGKGTWEKNPYVFVYKFKLID